MSEQSGAARSLWGILRLPLAIFAGTAGGLAAALLGDGAWHWLSWGSLAVPLVVVLVAIARPSRGT